MKRTALILLRNLGEKEKRYILDRLGNLCKVYFIDELDENDPIIETAEIALVSTARNEKVKRILLKAKNIRFIQSIIAGVDFLPLNILPKKAILASNAGANAKEVAEFAFSLILSALKLVPIYDRWMRKGVWIRKIPRLLEDITVVILGYGHIGRELAKQLRAFNVRIIGVNRSGYNDGNADKVVTIDRLFEVISDADVLVVALPLTKKTRGLIDKNVLSKMKKNAILVNVGRGGVINQSDLYEHLKNNADFIAALDVWWKYPGYRGEKVFQDYPFHELDNVIMTPHMAGTWSEFRMKLISHAIENVLRYLKGQEIKNIVDLSEYL